MREAKIEVKSDDGTEWVNVAGNGCHTIADTEAYKEFLLKHMKEEDIRITIPDWMSQGKKL